MCPKVRFALALALCAALAVAGTACNQLAKWRDSQIQTSHTIAQQGGPVLPPAVPITVPDDVLRDLPVDASYTFTSYTNHDDRIDLGAIAPWDAETTALRMLGRLAELGYDSGDNPSRILEGCEYLGDKEARFQSIWVKVTLNASDQCLVELKTSPPS